MDEQAASRSQLDRGIRSTSFILRIALSAFAATALGACGLSRSILYAPRTATSVATRWVHSAPSPIAVRTSDDLLLQGYYWPGEPGDRDIFVYFHGRHFNAEIAAKYAQHLQGRGDAVLVASYRGFGDNPGKPSETGLERDALAFIAQARTLAGPSARLWLVGHSIGAAVALHAANDDPHIAGVFALSAFVRVADAAPPIARALIPDRWDNVAALKQLHFPVIFVQGALDKYIPPQSGQKLLAAYSGPASLFLGEQAHHNPDMTKLGPWIARSITTIETGGLRALPPPPAGWIEQASHP